MNLDQYTDRARSVLQGAQSAALSANHQQLTPSHILAALLDDRDHLAVNLIRAAGGQPERVEQGVAAALQKIPSVSGGDGRLYASNETAKLLVDAEKQAKSAGDSFVTSERLLLALATQTADAASAALRDAGVTPQALEGAIANLRQGRTADSQNAEEGYEALKKYTRDLTEDARKGKLDPVIGRDEEIRRTVQ
ncbi:MAG: Clp protease N-terminal domain-containing protein, partial [Pseudomonadota bacterium]